MVKHIAFFEVIGQEEQDSYRARVATAGLFTLRLIDHWVLVGMEMVEPESVSICSVRKAIAALPAEDAQRPLLFGMINALQTLQTVDVEPLLPRLRAYAQLLEQEEWAKSLAADVRDTASRLLDEQR